MTNPLGDFKNRSMINKVLAFGYGIQLMQFEFDSRLDDRINEEADKYWAACSLPRKKKKRVRKKAKQEILFLNSLKNLGPL